MKILGIDSSSLVASVAIVTDDVLKLYAEPTEPEEEEEKKIPFLSGNSWIGLVMIAGVLTALLAGAMIFKGSRRNRF